MEHRIWVVGEGSFADYLFQALGVNFLFVRKRAADLCTAKKNDDPRASHT